MWRPALHLSLGLTLTGAIPSCASSSTVEPTATPLAESAPPTTTAQGGPGETTPKVKPFSQDPVVQAIWENGTNDSQVHEHLRYLTERFGARLTSSHALMAAEWWCKEQFANWGLSARLEKWGQWGVGFDRGPWWGRVTSPTVETLNFTTRAWSAGQLGPVRGPAVLYPSNEKELKAAQEKLEGAWVIRPPRRRGQRHWGGANSAAKESKREKKTRERIENAVKSADIAGFVDRSRDDELVHTSGRPNKWSEIPQHVEISLQGKQYDTIVKQLDEVQAVELEFSIDNRFFKGPVPLYNVIAEIPGTEKPDEYVIVGGHLDSWDGALGVVDNGTGVATTMEAARLLMKAGAKPKRTIRFMLWSGEEQGLYGSREYIRQHPEEMQKISGVFVHDGGTNFLSGLSVTPEMRPQFETVFEPIKRLSPETHPFELGYAESLIHEGSDHSPFINAGVPGFFWEQSGRSNYNHMHHTQHDTLDKAIGEYQQHSAMVVAIMAWNVANLDNLLDRTNSAPLDKRRMGVRIPGDSNEVRWLSPDGMAKAAGWKVGDRVVNLDGKPVSNLRDIASLLQKGGPRKVFIVERKGRNVETILDYSKDKTEEKREKRQSDRLKQFGPPPVTSN